MNTEERLPEGWVETTLGDILPIQYGKGLSEVIRDKDGKVPVYGSSGVVGHHNQALTSDETLIVGRKGSIGSVFYSSVPCWAIDTTYFVERTDSTNLKFFLYLLSSLQLVRLDKSTAIPGLNRDDYNDITVKIPPAPEQQRIVAVIEQQFTRLDAAVASLRSAQAKLKQYRASLLKAAVEGELTKQWRAAHPASETGVQLLTRILAERRARWEEEQLAKMRERGITPKDDKWKKEYKEPQGPDVEQLPELPEGWCWGNLGQVAKFQNGRPFPSKEYTSSGIKLLRPGNMYADGIIRWTEINTRYLPEIWAERNPDVILFGRELVMNLTAQSLKDEFLGRVCITGEDDRCLLNQRLARITTHTYMNRYYILYMLKSWIFRRFIDNLNTGSLIQHMFTSQLDNFSFPLPPLAEQAQIVAEVEAELSRSEQLEGVIEADLKWAEHERQSILREAFAGRLVAQEPGDEPASVLLERIREERKRREEAENVIKTSRKGTPMELARRRRASRARAGRPGVGLYETLVAAGEPLPPDDLFKRVGLKADEQPESNEVFYEELEVDVEDSLIQEIRLDKEVQETKPEHDVLLEALEPSAELLERMEAEAVQEEVVQEELTEEQMGYKMTLWDMENM